MPETILSIRDLIKTYDNGVTAVNGVSFDVDSGEFLAIIGLSGSGKSTLLRCVNRLHKPTAGVIEFDGVDVVGLAPAAVRALRTQIAMIFQHFNLIDRHTVISNVLMGRLGHVSTLASLFNKFSTHDRKQAMEYLELVGIADKAHVRADQLSGGQKQRVAIARALMQQPRVLLADEPVASLDPATCHSVMQYLRKVNREMGITVLCNLHFLSLVRQYADKVIAMKSGEIVYCGQPDEIDDDWFARIYGEQARQVEVQ